MSLRYFMKTEKGTDLLTEVEEEDPEQNNFIKEFTKKKQIQDAIDRLKKEKQKTAVEFGPNSSKIAVMLREKNQNDLQ